MFSNYLLLIVVALLWGATNPFIRRGSVGVEDVKAASAIKQFLAEIAFLITRWQAIFGTIPGEQRASLKNYIGMTLVMLGTTICMVAKTSNETTQMS